MGIYYGRFDMKDSALYYLDSSTQWEQLPQQLSYALQVVKIDPALAGRVRPVFEEAVNWQKSRLPSEMWKLFDAVEEIFEGYVNADTTKLIEAFTILGENPSNADDDERMLGMLLIRTGQYAEGIELIEPFIEGKDKLSSGFTYLRMRYYLGMAFEGLGERDKAIANYEEVLRYWDKADIEIEDIRDSRQRLARLRS